MNVILIPLLAAANETIPVTATNELATATATTATNELATATATIADSSSSGDSSFPWTIVGIVIVVVVVVAFVLRKLVKATPSAEKLDKKEIVDAVLEAVTKRMPERDALRAELTAAIAGTEKLTSSVLAAILRIEESYEKLPSGNYRRRILVLRSKEGSSSGVLSKIESEIGWEFIPDAVRGEFIRNRQDKIVRCVYDAGKAGNV